jgi:ParB-like chromosome segregation protein Spo0J
VNEICEAGRDLGGEEGMTLVRESRMKVQDIPVARFTPNPWNPNRMSDTMYAKLRAYVEREGFVEPIIARAHGDSYEILGGEHRWKVARELGHDTVPCIVVELDDRRAKILSINLNELKGQSAPDLLAGLVHDLSRDTSLEDLATQLPYDLADLRDLTELLKIPDGLDLKLDDEASTAERERMQVMTFPLTTEQHEIVGDALDAAKRTTGPSRSGALTHVASEFLRGVRGGAEARGS